MARCEFAQAPRHTLNERAAIFLDQRLRNAPGSEPGALLVHAVTQHRDQPLLASPAHVLLEQGFGDLVRVPLSSLPSCGTPLFPLVIVHARASRPCCLRIASITIAFPQVPGMRNVG